MHLTRDVEYRHSASEWDSGGAWAPGSASAGALDGEAESDRSDQDSDSWDQGLGWGGLYCARGKVLHSQCHKALTAGAELRNK
jgi:hypothetical protein